MSRKTYTLIHKESDIKNSAIKKIIDIKIEVLKCIDADIYIKNIDALFKLENDIIELIDKYIEFKRDDLII